MIAALASAGVFFAVPLVGRLALGVYRPEYIGAAGWLTIAVLVAAGKVGRPRLPRLSAADRFALIGILLAVLGSST